MTNDDHHDECGCGCGYGSGRVIHTVQYNTDPDRFLELVEWPGGGCSGDCREYEPDAQDDLAWPWGIVLLLLAAAVAGGVLAGLMVLWRHLWRHL